MTPSEARQRYKEAVETLQATRARKDLPSRDHAKLIELCEERVRQAEREVDRADDSAVR